jgi:glycosyltransferase involved in cell wall biosynthesis
MCLLLPSRREGLGLGIVEAMARGTPAVVTRSADNAATELIEEQENGVVAESADPEVLAGAITAVHRAGGGLHERTHAWFEANALRLTIDASIVELEAVYADAINGAARRPLQQAQGSPQPDPEEARSAVSKGHSRFSTG